MFERGAALGNIAALAREVVRSGSGRLLVVDGAPGIGKSALLGEVRGQASEEGMTVLSASGAELEKPLAYGVVRQLFTPLIGAGGDSARMWRGAAALALPVVDPTVRAAAPEIDAGAAMHGLVWLCAALAARGGLLLVVDDAHWADAASLGWIAYLTRRVSELPVLVALATRPWGHELGGAEVLDGFSVDAVTVTLSPLSEQASTALLRGAVGPAVPDDVCRACHVATGGNPFYLRELIAAGGEALLSGNGAPIDAMAPARVVRAIVARLSALGPDAERLARAISILGARVELHHAATLAELDPAVAEQLADRLAGAGILLDERPPRFVHPIVRNAVYGSMGEGARGTMHHKAARILYDRGADPIAIGVALLSTEPHADPWVVARLREAASGARSRGDPRAATAYLVRALREPSVKEDRSDVLFELGTVERQLLEPAGVQHLREAHQLAESPTRRVRLAFELSLVLSQPGGLAEALELIDEALPEVEHAPHIAAVFEAHRLGLCAVHLATQPDIEPSMRLLEKLKPEDRPARILRSLLALDGLFRGRPVQEAWELMDVALAGGTARIVGDITISTVVALAATLCERFEAAGRVLDATLERAQRRGAEQAAGQAWSFRSQLYLRLGKVADAEADARLALDALEGIALAAIRPMPVEALLERDQPEEALELLTRAGGAGELPVWMPSLLILTRRMALWVALGRLDAALADLAQAERLAMRAELGGSVVIPWRAEGALTCMAAGDERRARALADEHLRLARSFGAAGALGGALRVAGSVRRGERALELLELAVATLADTPMRLERAKALTALGAAQRRAGGRTQQARETLTQALDLADVCGARAVAGQARAELLLAGARPRRNRIHGPEALTASQLRVATLASEGATNVEIAQALFVTLKTIERHLTTAYDTLQISSRKQLAGALAGAPV